MEFPDHHYPSFTIPFPAQPDVLKYIQSFADRFDLKKLIRFHHVVVRVAPIEDDKWEIIVKNLPSNTYETRIFDAVFVTTGQFTQPNIPKFPGANEFKGKLLHSHEYRSAEKYQGTYQQLLYTRICTKLWLLKVNMCLSLEVVPAEEI